MKHVNKEIYEGRVTQQVPSFVYEEYLQDGTFSPSTVAIFLVMASKSENYEFNKSEMYEVYGRKFVDKAFKEMILAGHIIQVNFSVSNTKRKVLIHFFVEPRTSSEVNRIVNTLLSTRLKSFPSAKPNKETMEYINKDIQVQRSFKKAQKRKEKNSEGGWNIVVSEDDKVIPCKEVPRINGQQIFYVPLECSDDVETAEIVGTTKVDNVEDVDSMSFLLEGIYEMEGVSESPEFDPVKEGYAHKSGKPIFLDVDGMITNKAIIHKDILCSNYIVGKEYKGTA
ncbi:hypothetical protein [Bacillus cereus]|uniref:hypothetical protein n=1 Tax=Bacillus cereus TaxID=1396 RepID=UPI001E4F9088|nr:hypothetical protein [Bacillus cereus]MCD2337377.1 hypothetical protein [Bacillus cereus]